MRKADGRKGKRRGFGFGLILSGVLLLWLLLRARLDPLLRDLAVTAAKNAALQAMQLTVAEKLAAGDLDYERLVHLEKDADGLVTAAVADMAQVNRLQSELTAELLAKLTEPGTADLSVPLGNLLGAPLLSGLGPDIPVRILSVAELDAQLVSSFTHAGINQTLHRLLLEIRALVFVLIPGSTVTAEVSDTVTVAETVLLGRVPESYMYFESDDNWDEALEQYDILS